MDHRAVARRYAALGSDIRLRILDLISAHKEICVCELVDLLELSQANVSRHVSLLREAGLISDRKIGTWVLLRVNAEALGELHGEVAELIDDNHAQSKDADAEARLEARCADGLPPLAAPRTVS